MRLVRVGVLSSHGSKNIVEKKDPKYQFKFI
jgi:hypothetical protein